MKENLIYSAVFYNEENHTYWLNGRQLSGITGVIRRHIFPNKYDGVPQAVLDRRAEFGHDFHADMELYINTGVEPDNEMFRVFKENFGGIRFIASEYIVSDGENFASPIDAVDEDGVLYDFKTSSKKDYEYWRWQLSTYKYLFELQNGWSPSGLSVIWINKDMERERVDITDPIDSEVIAALLKAEVDGTEFSNPFRVVETGGTGESIIPSEKAQAIAAIEQEIVKREKELKEIKANHDEMKAALLEAMTAHNITSWETDVMKVTVKAAYGRTTVDSKELKTKYPEAYDACSKTTVVKPSLIIKLK